MSRSTVRQAEVEPSTSAATKTINNSNSDLKVLVPSWREIPIKRIFGMEGTEVCLKFSKFGINFFEI